MNKSVKTAIAGMLSNPEQVRSLKLFSVNDAEYKARISALSKVMERTCQLEDLAINGGAKRRVAQFAGAGVAAAGAGAADLRGLSIFPAIILSYVNSIAPIFCVERDLDAVNASLMYVDFYSLMEDQLIYPNIGKDKSFGKNTFSSDITSQVNGVLTDFSVVAAQKLIPGTVMVSVGLAAGKEILVDNKQGKLLGTAGLLSLGTINYVTGEVEFCFTVAPAAATKIIVTAATDVPASTNVDKLAGYTKYYNMTAAPIEIPIIRNIITDAALSKQGIVDINEMYTNLIQTSYTKLINTKVANTLISNYAGDTYTADLSGFDIAAGRYDTFIRSFQSLLVNGETILGQQTYKGSKVTGILAGYKIANVFQYMISEEGWVPNDTLAYFKDLIGWYRGVPVVRWEDDQNSLAADELILTHKTSDGQLAPCFRGMYIAPTDLPEIGNFNNPSQIVNGMFSMEEVGYTTSALSVKLKIHLPDSQQLTKAL